MENKLEYYSNSIDVLNDDCLMHTFQFLPLTKRINLERVCKRWQRVSKKSWYDLHTFNLYSQQDWIFQENLFDKSIADIETVAEAIYAILQRGGRFVKNLGYFGFAEEFLAIGAQLGLLCPNVQIVKLCGVSKLTIRSLAKNCTEIRKLCLRDSIHPCDDELSLLFLNNRKLRTFAYICESTTKGGKFLLDLPANSMRKLELLDTNISSKYFKKAIQELTNLRILKFDVCENFDNESINAISSIKSLEKIQTGYHLGAIKSLEPLIELSNLKVIELSFCSCVNDAFLLKLSKKCRELLQVNISYCTVSDVGVRYITSLPKLEELCVNNLSITDKAFCLMPNLTEIECFSCQNLTTSFFIKLVKTCKHLKVLAADQCQLNISTIIYIGTIIRKQTNNVKMILLSSRFVMEPMKNTSGEIPSSLQVIFISRVNEKKNYV